MIFTILWGVGIVNKASEAEINDPRTPVPSRETYVHQCIVITVYRFTRGTKISSNSLRFEERDTNDGGTSCLLSCPLATLYETSTVPAY